MNQQKHFLDSCWNNFQALTVVISFESWGKRVTKLSRIFTGKQPKHTFPIIKILIQDWKEAVRSKFLVLDIDEFNQENQRSPLPQAPYTHLILRVWLKYITTFIAMQLTIEDPRVVLMLYSLSGPCQNISYSFVPSLSFSTCGDFFNCNIKGSQCK